MYRYNVSVYEGVELQDYVFCGPSIVFTNIKIPRSEFPQKGTEYYSKTIVRRSASIGANATIVCGVTIGEYSMIGAGAIVTKDVMPYSLMIGSPAIKVGWVSKSGDRLGDDLKCNRTGELYEEINGNLYKKRD